MAIHDSAKFSNIVRSLWKYVQDTFQGAGPIPSSFPAAQIWWHPHTFDPDKYPYYLRVSTQDEEGRFYPQVATGSGGFYKHVRLFVEVFIKHDYPRVLNNLHLLPDTLDLLKAGFLAATGITVKNYQGDGLTTLGKLWVRGRQPTTPHAKPWLAGGWMISLEWVEQDAAA